MFCPKCGTKNEDNAYRCVSCQEVIQIQPIPLASQPVNTDPAGYNSDLKFILPVGRSGLAVAAGYVAFFSIVPGFAELAIVLGILALMDIKKNPKKLGKGRAIFGIVLGALFTIIHIVWLVDVISSSVRL